MTTDLQKLKNSLAKEMNGMTPTEAAECERCVSCGRHCQKWTFRDTLSWKEYGISRLCQKCQDEVFGG